jgi:hypothetical protein
MCCRLLLDSVSPRPLPPRLARVPVGYLFSVHARMWLPAAAHRPRLHRAQLPTDPGQRLLAPAARTASHSQEALISDHTPIPTDIRFRFPRQLPPRLARVPVGYLFSVHVGMWLPTAVHRPRLHRAQLPTDPGQHLLTAYCSHCQPQPGSLISDHTHVPTDGVGRSLCSPVVYRHDSSAVTLASAWFLIISATTSTTASIVRLVLDVVRLAADCSFL